MDFVEVVNSEDAPEVEAVPLPTVLVVGVVVDDIAVVVDAEAVAGTGGAEGRRVNLLRVWLLEVEEVDFDLGDVMVVVSADGRRLSLRVGFADRKESADWGGTERDSAEARLCQVPGPVCQTVPPLIQHSPVAKATTILKRVLRASELFCKCHMFLALLTDSGQPHEHAHPASRVSVL